MHTYYTGQRVRLRPLASKEEALALQAQVRSLPNAHWGPGWRPPAALAKDYEANGGLGGASGENTFVIERLDTREAVGFESCGLWNPGSTNGWFGTSIAPAHRKLGFGREAKLLMLCFLFENFPVHRVSSDTVIDHWAARQGMEACGMKLEGYLRAAHMRGGQWYDVPWYVIFRHEWEQLPVRQYVQRG
jgi:RimJ/RimL family protein N-acetyltransferase